MALSQGPPFPILIVSETTSATRLLQILVRINRPKWVKTWSHLQAELLRPAEIIKQHAICRFALFL